MKSNSCDIIIGYDPKYYERHYIYILVDPRNGDIKYVGCTLDIKNRYQGHFSQKDNLAKYNWIMELVELGLKPIMRVIESFTDRNAMKPTAIENRYAAALVKEGCELFNSNRYYKKYIKNEQTT